MSATLLDHLEAPAADAAGASAACEEIADAIGSRVLQAVAQEREAQVRLLVAAADWADAHVHVEPTGGAPGFDRPLVLAGAGAPVVSDYAVSELGALMGVSFEAAFALLGDAIELRHRLPELWKLTTTTSSTHTVPVALARQIAELTRDLSLDAALDADRRLCRSRQRIDRRRARIVIDETRLWHDPDRAVDDEQRSLARRGAWVYPRPAQHHTPATTEMYLLLDAVEAERFDKALSRVATALGELGDTDSWDIRRAKAVGVLADPQTALELLNGETDRVHRPGQPAVLYLHLTDTALLEQGPVSIERLGTASKDLVRDWLTGSHVTIRPVANLDRRDAVDHHDPPEWMREQVILRDRHCIFPGCTRDARTCDLDHIDPYVPPHQGGPPGQTHPRNLAPLCRRHHRAKTHARFSYQRLPDRAYRWTLPTGHQITAAP